MAGETGKPRARATDEDNAVGYGRPPVHSRFKPGQSGNPKGRPRGSKNRSVGEPRLGAIILEEAYRTVTVRDGERNVTVPIAQAVVRSLAVNAAKGQHRAQRLFTELVDTVERQNKEAQDNWIAFWLEYKLTAERALKRCHDLGLDPPDHLPHPDHVIVDLRKNTVQITGPTTKAEKLKYDFWVAGKYDLGVYRDGLREATSGRRKRTWQMEELARVEAAIANIGDLLTNGGWWNLPMPPESTDQKPAAMQPALLAASSQTASRMSTEAEPVDPPAPETPRRRIVLRRDLDE